MGLAGTAWAVASVHYEAWLESVYCLMIATGFILAATAVQGTETRGAFFAAGMGLGGIGIAMPVITGAFGGAFSLVDPWTVLSVVALATAGFAFASRGHRSPGWSPLAMRLALAASTLASLWLVLANDLTGPSWWTPGNLLAVVGFGLMTLVSWKARPSSPAPVPQ